MNLFKRSSIKKYFKKEDLERLKNAIGDVEKMTSAEMRVKIIHKMDKDIKNVYDQAVHEFVKEKMDLTRDFTGLLILIALEDRKFQILADKGILAKIPQEFFDGKAMTLSGAFAKGAHVEALLTIIAFIGVELATHFPKKPDDKNELPNDVVVENEPKKEEKK